MKENQFYNLSQAARFAIGICNVVLAAGCLVLLAFVIMLLLFTAGAKNWNPSYRGGLIFLTVSGLWVLRSVGLFLTTSVIAIWKQRWSLTFQILPFAGAIVLYIFLVIASYLLL